MEDLNSYIILPINSGDSIQLIPNLVSGPSIGNESDIVESDDKVYTNIEYFISSNSGLETFYANATNTLAMPSGNIISAAFMENNETTSEFLYKCSNCEMKFHKYNQYLDHLQSHENKTSFQCKKCKKVFNQTGSYHKHIMTHHEEKRFSCTICHEGFNVENNFKVHMALHGTTLVCPICELSFQRTASLKSHLAIHQVEELLICSECSSEFENVVDLRKHIKTHTLEVNAEQNELTCNYCKVKFETPILLRQHIASHLKVKKLVHNGKRNNRTDMGNKEHKHKCAICNKTFPKLSLLERHTRIHSGERPYVCTICDKGFTQKGTLQIHMTKHSGIKPFCCTLCPAKFNQKGNLKVHVQKTHTATTEDEKIFKCSQCDCIFKKVASLNGHMTKIHSLNTAEICIASIINHPKNINKQLVADFLESENFAIPQFSENRIEINLGNGIPEEEKISKVYSLKQKFIDSTKVYICSYCDKETKKPSDLIRHLRTHTKEKPFKCFCGSCFSTKSTLLSHMQIHRGNIGKKCSKCSRVLFSMKSWNSHMRKHDMSSSQNTILKPHKDQNLELHEIEEQPNVPGKSMKCQHCSASFLKKGNLKRHIQLHSGKRKYKCHVCYRTFMTSSSFKEHMKFHSGFGKFECGVCVTPFATKSLLRKHLEIHNTLKPYECSHCKKKFKNVLACGRHISTHEKDNVKEDILSASFCYAEQKLSLEPPTQNIDESSSLLNEHPNAILEHLFDSDPKKATIASPDVDLIKNIDKFAPTSSPRSLELGKSQELQTFLVDCSTEVHEDEGLNNHFFSQLDLQPSGIISLDTVTEMDDSPMVFNVQNISEETFPAVDIMNSQLYSNNSSGPSDIQQPKSLLKNAQKNIASAMNNIVCLQNDISDNFLANNISLYPNTQISFDSASEINSTTIPLNLITSAEDICLKVTESNEQISEESLNLLNVSFSESEGNIGNSNVIHCLTCKKLFKNMTLYDSHACSKSILKKNNANESEKNMKSFFKIKENKELSKPEGKSQKPSRKNFCCVYCGKEFNSRGAYMRHVNTHQKNVDGLHTCKFCMKKFKKPSDLSRHLRTHTGEKPFACGKCDKKFSLKSTLEGHYKTHNPEATKDFLCELCNSFFTSKSSRKLHMHVHTGMKPHKCSSCDQHFRTLAHKRSHEQKIHSNFPKTNSSIKSKYMMKASVAALEVDSITEKAQNSDLLETAELTEIKIGLPSQEDQTVKLTDTIQIDDVFLQQLRNSNIIIEVLQDFDNNEQSSVITIDENTIQKIASTTAEPYEHISDENPEIESGRNLECEICQKKYASKDVLRKHMQLHLKNKFVCEQCNKWFSTIESLFEHEKLHSGHRPFSCFLCRNNFAELQHLKSHLKRIHQIVDTNSPLILKMSMGETDV